MMSIPTKVCALIIVSCIVISEVTNATYIDCSMECLFAAFREPTVCECQNTLKLHWGKRAPRTRAHLPTFRYGKRAVALSDFDENRIDTLRSIQNSFQSDSLPLEYDA